MKIIDDIFSELSDVNLLSNQIISNHIKNGLEKSSIKLTTKQVNSIVEIVISGSEISDMDLSFTEKQIKKSIYSNASDASKGIEKELGEYLNYLSEDTPEKDFEIIKDNYIQKYLGEIEKTKASFIKKNIKARRSFEKRLSLLWSKPLNSLEVLIHLATEIGSNYQKEHPLLSRDEYFLYQALLRLHAKACQTSLEILKLLRSGFADGAIARWRLLYEIVIVSYFLKKHGNDTAEMFLGYGDVTAYQAMINYQENACTLGYEPYTDEEMAEGLRIKEEYKEQYGCSTKGGYGWASLILNKQKPTFFDIEKAVNQEHNRPFYKKASSSIHAGAKGLFNQYGIYPGVDSLLAGPSNYGLTDPCRYTAIFLTKITASFVLRNETSSNVAPTVALQILNNLIDQIEDSAVEIENRFNSERINGN